MAQKAYEIYSVRPALEQNANNDTDVMEVDERNFDSRMGWREALGFEHKLKGWQFLWIRFATDLDKKKESTKGKDSRFYRFQKRTYDKHDRYDRHSRSSLHKKGIYKKEKYGDRRRRRRSSSNDDKAS